MREMITAYLLFKSATRQKLTWFDSKLASALMDASASNDAEAWLSSLKAPSWLRMIASLKQEVALPEAFGVWRFDLENAISTWWGKLWGRS